MDNYPPGFDPKSLDNLSAEQRGVIEAQTKLRFNLTVEVDGDVVYEGSSPTSDGLNFMAAEEAVDKKLDEMTRASMEGDE